MRSGVSVERRIFPFRFFRRRLYAESRQVGILPVSDG
jgi:hypothetical protein